MNAKEAREILKPFDAYKTFPLTWLATDERGNPSALSTAEAHGYLEALSGPEVAVLVEALDFYANEACSSYGYPMGGAAITALQRFADVNKLA